MKTGKGAITNVIFIICLVLVLTSPGATASDIFLDADTPGTGSLLGTQPLVTAFGTISFVGEIRDRDSDPDFNAAGALGNVFDIDNETATAELSFDFDIVSATFIYGGNYGSILVQAKNAGGTVVDSFYQANTGDGYPAGPVKLSGRGIRSIYWEDPGNMFAALDNINIMVPEPATMLLLGLGVIPLIQSRNRHRATKHHTCNK